MKDERTPASTPVVKSSHVTVPAEVASLVKVAAYFLGISRSSLVINSIKLYLRSVNFEDKVLSQIGPQWTQTMEEADKPATFRRAAKN